MAGHSRELTSPHKLRSLVHVAATLTALACSIVLPACGSSPSGGDSGGAAEGSNSGGSDTYVIGAALAQTGGLAFVDQPLLQGARVAIDEINASGGIAGKYRIEHRVQDMRSDTGQAAVAARSLIDRGVDFLLVPSDGDPGVAAGQIATRAKVPAMGGGSLPFTPQQGGEYLFSDYTGENYIQAAMAQYAKKRGYRTAYLLGSPQSAYTQAIPKYFKYSFEAEGGRIVGSADFKLDQTDFGAIITRIRQTSPAPDAIFTSAYGPAFSAFIRQLRGAGVTIPVLGNDGLANPETYALGSAVDGLAVSSSALENPGGELEKFYATMTERYGKSSANFYAALGYNDVLLIAAAVEKAGSTDGPKVRDALATIEDVPGLLGPMAMTPERVQTLPIYVLRVHGGTATRAHTFDAASAKVAPPDPNA